MSFCFSCFATFKQACGTTPHIRDTNHLFLELPLLKDKLEEYIIKTSVVGSWSQNAIQVTNAWLKEGLKQRCITRDLKWGVPVPHDNFQDKVINFIRNYAAFPHLCIIYNTILIFS